MSARRFSAPAVALLLLAGIAPWRAAAQAPPNVPTTKILAIGHMTAGATTEALLATLPQEVRDTVTLHLDGRIEQWFSRRDQRGVVFILDTTDLAEAHAMLERLPLGRAGLMEFDLIPLGPLAPLGLLLGGR